jgi:hypothetical protein
MGSPIVEMSFPMWTNGCIDSMEGIYFESSTSTPFHFLDQAELSMQASNPVVGLPYQSLNVLDGVAHLQLEGVQYFLANSTEVESQAALDPLLVKIASTAEGPGEEDGAASGSSPNQNHPGGTPAWVLYRIRNSIPVTPLRYQPVVESGLSKTAWLALGIRWYQSSSDWSVPIAENGPSAWRRIKAGTLVAPSSARALPNVQVSDLRMSDDGVTFSVSKIGVPVLVKIPYFPNWQSTGASAPVEVTPNEMVVVPTSKNVKINYGTTTVDWIGRAGSLVGFAGLVALWRPTDMTPPPPRIKSNDDEADEDGSGELPPPWPMDEPDGIVVPEDSTDGDDREAESPGDGASPGPERTLDRDDTQT